LRPPRLPCLKHTPACFTSAVRGEGVPEVFDTIDKVAAEFGRRVGPAEVTATLRAAIERRPVSVGGVPLALQSASQVSAAPPTFALRVNKPDDIHFSYERYLVKSLRHAFGFAGTPIRLSLRQGAPTRATPRRRRPHRRARRRPRSARAPRRRSPCRLGAQGVRRARVGRARTRRGGDGAAAPELGGVVRPLP